MSGAAFDASAATFPDVFATGPCEALLARDLDARVEVDLPRELLFRPRELPDRVFPRLELLERLAVVALLALVLRLVVDRVVWAISFASLSAFLAGSRPVLVSITRKCSGLNRVIR